MKKILAIGFVFIVLTGSIIDLHDLAKLPFMISHYQQHRNKSTSFSLSEFFSLHYGAQAESHDKEEHEQHKGLPFKTHDCTFTHVVTLSPFCNTTQRSNIITVVTYTNFYQSTFASAFIQSIWQPPRLV